ncbi:MAG: translation elongation factor Ts [Alphaproteobacteria bacterium]|jgi:elongation factor Ts
MAEITAAAVKELREKSGAGMMDCKAALTETDGDMDAAVDWLRKKGLSAAAKKAGRAAAEGLVGMVVEGGVGALVEVNAETDFVARNETFQKFVAKVAQIALENGADVDALKAADFGDGNTVEEATVNQVATIGENIGLRRSTRLNVSNGTVSGYIHNQIAPGMGKIGVLVALESDGDAAKLDEIGRQLAMHVAAAQPQFLNISSVDASALDREREVLAEQARASGKPDEIVQKMVEGRLRKYYEEVVLTEQVFVIDGETKVSKFLEAAAKDVGSPINIAGFERFTLGEGVERREEDFADEVAKLTN